MSGGNGRRVVRTLRCDLTQNEVLERGKELASTISEADIDLDDESEGNITPFRQGD